MGSIPKIVSTPLKWASKQVLNRTLLRFPGGDSHDPIACVYCPEMCRFSCPTAVVSGNDAVTPCNKMGLVYKEKKWPGQASQGAPLWPIYDCTGCGRCTEYCVYEMPVMEQLFEARKSNRWEVADRAASELTDEQDPVGDLADELGAAAAATRRAREFSAKPSTVIEPRSLYFLKQQGIAAESIWDRVLSAPPSKKMLAALSGKTWLFHESVWFSRQLGRDAEIQTWINSARALGVEIRRPFHTGRDCIDCGGEGAYRLMFPVQARQMAVEIWERDRHRAQGVLCLTGRCAEHLRASLGDTVPVVALSELS
ncbi:MAG: hypothetical protein ACXWP5_00800 [Bdellovibrionota bacterium]